MLDCQGLSIASQGLFHSPRKLPGLRTVPRRASPLLHRLSLLPPAKPDRAPRAGRVPGHCRRRTGAGNGAQDSIGRHAATSRGPAGSRAHSRAMIAAPVKPPTNPEETFLTALMLNRIPPSIQTAAFTRTHECHHGDDLRRARRRPPGFSELCADHTQYRTANGIPAGRSGNRRDIPTISPTSTWKQRRRTPVRMAPAAISFRRPSCLRSLAEPGLSGMRV